MHTFLGLLSLVVLCGYGHTVIAANKTDQLKNVKAQIHALEKVLSKQQKQENRTEQELRKIEKSLASGRLMLEKYEREIKQKNRQLAELQQEAKKLDRRLMQQKQHLKQQIRSAYMIGQQGQLQLLLNQKDTAALDRMSAYYNYLNQARAQRIHIVDNDIKALRTIQQRIQTQKSQRQALRDQQAQQTRQLKQQANQRSSLLSALRKQMQQQQNQLGGLEKDKRRITTLINSLETVIDDIPAEPPKKTIFSQQRGKLIWPSKGRVKHTFGKLRAGQELRWQGLFIQQKVGATVKAVADGRVVYADWLAGFGLITIIDHQDNYMSLYAHNSVLFKELGDWVTASETIAKVGQTGGIDSAGLYFEIRKKGVPINPKKWLAKR